ncbi:MAG: dTMP kinase [Bacteroidota bacterium]
MVDNSLFIVIEGLDGSGKTSVSRHLTSLLDAENHGKVKITFEPHDPSCAGLFIRQVLMKKIRKFSPKILALAFATNRLDHCDREINPWLESQSGNIIICDRYYLSSLVYQSSDDFSFQDVLDLNDKARKPDVIFFLNVSNKVCYERMKDRNEPKELFETNLSTTRNKFTEAIQFLREKNNDNIVEIDASVAIEEVALQILEKLYELRPNLKPRQPFLSNKLIQKPRVTTLNGKNPYSLKETSLELKVRENQLFENDDENSDKKLIRHIESQIDSMNFNKLGGLFLDYIKLQEISVGEKLPWTEMDAYELEYEMPVNIKLRGVGLILQEKQRYDVLIKKAPDIPKMSDFMFIFSPGPSELVTHYYERDQILYNTGSKGEGLFPSAQPVTQRDLAEGILRVSRELASSTESEKV